LLVFVYLLTMIPEHRRQFAVCGTVEERHCAFINRLRKYLWVLGLCSPSCFRLWCPEAQTFLLLWLGISIKINVRGLD